MILGRNSEHYPKILLFSLKYPFCIHCSKDLKERRTIFPYIAALNTPKFKPHLKAIQNDPKCPLLLHHLTNASKVLTTRNFIQEMSFLGL